MSTADAIYRDKPTQAEIDDVLGQRLTGAVATINPDGSIHLAYVIFLFEEGNIYWETASSTRKAKNLAADATTSFLVDGQATTGRNLMVSGSGNARIISGAKGEQINRRLRAKYVSADALETVNEVWGSFDDVCVEVTASRWRSWTNQTFTAATLAAFGDKPPESIWRND